MTNNTIGWEIDLIDGVGASAPHDVEFPFDPVPGAFTFTEAFTRANENLEADANWTLLAGGAAGGAAIRSNKLSCLTALQSVYRCPDTGSPDHYVEFTIEKLGAGTNAPFVAVRLLDVNNFVGVRNVASGLQLYKRVSGVFTLLATHLFTDVLGDTVKLSVQGNIATVALNGVAKISSALGGSLPTITRAGIVARAVVTDPWIDNFEAGLVSPPAPVALDHKKIVSRNIAQFMVDNGFTRQITPVDLGKAVVRGRYASNVWDMQVFEDRIYLGAGNSSNFAPENNSGAGLLYYWDIETEAFVSTGFTPTEEQIESFRVIDGQLVIPGHDLRGISGPPTRFYRLESGVWTTRFVTGSQFHTYDIYKFGSLLFAGIGSFGNSRDVTKKSSNNGATWSNTQTTASPDVFRTYRFFEFDGEMYCTTAGVVAHKVLRWNGTSFVTAGGATGTQLFPGLTQHPNFHQFRPERITLLGSSLVYIAGCGLNDHQWDGIGFYAADVLTAPTMVSLRPGEVPWDTLLRGSTVYVLTSRKLTDGMFRIMVRASTDLMNWNIVLWFDWSTFARSFEELDGEFYFGLGTGTALSGSYTDTLKADSGKILRCSTEGLP